MFWNYSNLLFYGLIFKTFNHLNSRDLTKKEAQNVFDAYLIINGIANNKISIEKEVLKKAEEVDKIEEITIPNFIYQKDYSSSTDFSNQVIRGVKFFKYLENHPKLSTSVYKYYKSKNVSGYLRMFKNLMILFTEINIKAGIEQRFQLAKLEDYNKSKEIDLAYIDTLCINNEISEYKEDHSFGIIRNKFLYKINQHRYFILDVNFLLDQFYKAQIFSFNSFLKAEKVKIDFLSEKGKNFTEKIHLPDVLNNCFPHYTTFYGDDCVNSKNKELCDAYLRENNNICLIEFKDVLLNAKAKNSANKEMLFLEFDKKFLSNQKNKPKGITQLINSIKDIETNSILFDKKLSKSKIKIYPTIVYTDFSFGIEGVNKIYKERFMAEINTLNLKNTIIKDVTFVNLNFFELREDYFSQKLMNLFVMLNEYHKHTLELDYQLTTFEVFSRFYMNNNVPQDLGNTKSFLNITSKIVKAK